MKCPNCNVTLLITERSGIEIDYCPECRGIWLDRGELDKFIDKSSTYTQPSKEYTEHKESYRPNHAPVNPNYNQHQPHHKKKESWISDIFDF